MRTARHLAAILAFGVGVPVLLSLLGAPLRMPRNDAWSYSRTAELLHDTGHYELLRYGRMTLVGHIGWAQPFLSVFENREVAGNVAGIVACAVALPCFYLLARRFVDPTPALVATGVLAIFPGLAATVPTFMTEPTALALTSLALLLSVTALRARGLRSRLLLAGAVAVAVAGFSVREFGLAVLIAVVAAALLVRPALRGSALVTGLVGLAACAAIYLWHAQLPFLEPTELRFDPTTSTVQVVRGVCTLALGLLPITAVPALTLLRRARRQRHLLIGLLLGGAVVTSAVLASLADVSASRSVLATNMLTRFGVSSQSLAVGARPAVLPDVLYGLVNLAAVVGTVCLALATAELIAQRVSQRLPGGDWVLLELFVVSHLVIVFGFALFGPLFEERYLWPVIVPAVILLDRVRPRILSRARLSRATGWCAAAVLVFAAVTIAQDSGAYDGERWRAAERLVEQGVDPQDIDAGLEWVGAHARGPRSLAEGRVDILHPHYELFFPRRRCWVVSNEALNATANELISTTSYRSLLWVADRALYVHRRRGCTTG